MPLFEPGAEARGTAPEAGRGPSILVVAAHADDAITGAAGWLCGRPGSVSVAFLTDGVPRERRWFSDHSRDPERYRRRRHREAIAAWQRHRPEARLVFGSIADQELAFSLDRAAAWLQPLLSSTRPDLILVPAFEGGHPDHDAANCLLAHVADSESTVLEYALYTRHRGETLYQRFPDAPGFTRRLDPTSLARKRWAMESFRSQRSVLGVFDPAVESVRPLPRHDYAKRPRPEATVYESWGWPHTADAIARELGGWITAPPALGDLACAS